VYIFLKHRPRTIKIKEVNSGQSKMYDKALMVQKVIIIMLMEMVLKDNTGLI
jgi:hypothetical protein